MFTQNEIALLQAALEFFMGNTAPFDDEDKRECQDLIDKLIGWRGKMEWISVNDRLPDKDGVYLAYTNHKDLAACRYDDAEWQPPTLKFRGYITQWMKWKITSPAELES